MKNIPLVMLIVCSFAFSQGTQLKVYDYQLQANANVKTKNGKIGFATVKPVKNPKDETTFGFWFSNNTNQNATILEIKEGQKSIASVTAKDFSAKAKFQTAGTKSTASYKAGSGANAVDITVESNVITDETMPLGKTISVVVKARTSGTKSLSTALSLFGDGYVRKVGTNGVITTRVEKGKAEYPFVAIVGASGTAVGTESSEQKSPGRFATVSSQNVASSGTEVEVLSFFVNATTVKSFEKSVNQASNIETSLSSKKEVTELALLNSASNLSPFPGDTVVYSVTYHNVGNSFAQDAVIQNDVPANMYYVDNSAAGENSEITLARSQVAPPQQPAVTSISWKITKKIMPGEEGVVSFKAVVR